LTALTHDLGNLLDGSMRCLSLARRALVRDNAPDELQAALHHLETVGTAMERMSDLVHAAMRGSGSVVGSPDLMPARPITLEEAMTHAAEVLRPQADAHAIELNLSIDAGAG